MWYEHCSRALGIWRGTKWIRDPIHFTCLSHWFLNLSIFWFARIFLAATVDFSIVSVYVGVVAAAAAAAAAALVLVQLFHEVDLAEDLVQRLEKSKKSRIFRHFLRKFRKKISGNETSLTMWPTVHTSLHPACWAPWATWTWGRCCRDRLSGGESFPHEICRTIDKSILICMYVCMYVCFISHC